MSLISNFKKEIENDYLSFSLHTTLLNAATTVSQSTVMNYFDHQCDSINPGTKAGFVNVLLKVQCKRGKLRKISMNSAWKRTQVLDDWDVLGFVLGSFNREKCRRFQVSQPVPAFLCAKAANVVIQTYTQSEKIKCQKREGKKSRLGFQSYLISWSAKLAGCSKSGYCQYSSSSPITALDKMSTVVARLATTSFEPYSTSLNRPSFSEFAAESTFLETPHTRSISLSVSDIFSNISSNFSSNSVVRFGWGRKMEYFNAPKYSLWQACRRVLNHNTGVRDTTHRSIYLIALIFRPWLSLVILKVWDGGLLVPVLGTKHHAVSSILALRSQPSTRERMLVLSAQLQDRACQ